MDSQSDPGENIQTLCNSEIKQLCHWALKGPEVVCPAYLVFLNNSNFLSGGCLPGFPDKSQFFCPE